MMEKMKMRSPNLTQENIARIRDLFPSCVTEAQGEDGKLRFAVDFDQLRQELSESIVEGPQERYHLNWPGKREALLTANAPIAKTLRPCREESVDFDTTKNLFIEGDNLEALKLLQETYLGKVKMIYIDPPYNTGSDFIYEDDFAVNAEEFLKRSNQKDEEGNRLVANTSANGRFHSDWLTMIYARLRLARNLLCDDGLIFMSIDTGEEANLTKIGDEIFGEENRLVSIVWEKRFTRSNNAKTFATLTERIICYRKSAELSEVKEPRNEKADSTYSNPDNDPRGVWTSVSYVNPATRDQRPNLVYPITNPITGQVVHHPTNAWKYEKLVYESHVKDKKLYWGANGNNTYPRLKKFLTEMDGGMVPVDLWDRKSVGTTDEASKYLANLLEAKVFDFPKPYTLIQRAIRLSNSKDDVVLDFFAGTSPSAHAVMQQNAEDGGNRKSIMVQLPEPCDEKSEAFKAGYKTIAEISKERIRRAGKKILEGGCHEGWNKDIGFRVLKIDSSNMADVYYTPDAIEQTLLDKMTDNIKPERTPEDLLFQVLLDWGVDLSLPIRKETIQSKTVFFVNEPPYDLVACFDTGVNEDLVKELAQFEPLRVVFLDTGFVSDAVKINVEQIFKQMSPGTEVKSI
jgi:adenine-specific DNA-methyltransferase